MDGSGGILRLVCSILRENGRGGLILFNLILADHLKGGTVMRQVRTMMGVVAMDTAQSTRLVGAESLGVLGDGRSRSGSFRDRSVGERDFYHGANTG